MNARELLEALSVAERLKDTTRHCYTCLLYTSDAADE